MKRAAFIASILLVTAAPQARPLHGTDAIYYCNQALIQLEAQNPPDLTPEKYHAAAVKIEEAIAILESRQ